MGFDASLINGVSVGFEVLGKEQAEAITDGDGRWGFAFDILILRFLVIFF